MASKLDLPMKMFFLFSIFLYSHFCMAQIYPSDYASPIDIPIKLVGNFGELRKNHFHSGLDIKTNEEEGHAIFSIKEGYVSRINISGNGYGNALYVDHPDGYTSLYAHLQQFSPEITAYIRKKQYEQQLSEIEIYPSKGELMVEKGQQIALSGNSGSSTGPHLHFEIRDTKTEDAMNPFLFGLSVSDNKIPVLSSIYLYPMEGELDNKTNKFLLSNKTQEITGFGKFGVGITASDQHDFLPNVNGIYSIKVFANNKEIYGFRSSRVSFDRHRLINISTDYSEFMTHGRWIYKCFTTEGNDLKMIETKENNGFITLQKEEKQIIRIEVKDFAGNQTTREFTVIGIENEQEPIIKNETTEKSIFISYKNDYLLSKENIELLFPKGVFSEDINFHFKELEDGFEIHESNYPALDYFTIKATPKNIAPEDWSKTIFIRQYKKGNHWQRAYEGGTIENGKLVTKARDFGIYRFYVDKKAPNIVSRLPKNKKVTTQIRFTIADYAAGIDSYNVFIDQKWTVAVYDKKYNSLVVNVDETLAIGEHQLLLEVTDKVKNRAEISFTFEKI